MARRSPGGFTKAIRRKASQHPLGHRPVNNWGDGDLPAPWAAGDIIELPHRLSHEQRQRLSAYGIEPRPFQLLFVDTAFSVDEGDAWYFRVDDGEHGSDRLHVASAARSGWDHDCDYMAGFRLIETLDPDGLSLRNEKLMSGWKMPSPPDFCPTCRRPM